MSLRHLWCLLHKRQQGHARPDARPAAFCGSAAASSGSVVPAVPAASSGSVAAVPAASSGSAVRGTHVKTAWGAWGPPTKAVIGLITQHYTRAGREHFGVPKSDHVVLGHHTKTRNGFAAYCQQCQEWFDWPPKYEKPHVGTPCCCVSMTC